MIRISKYDEMMEVRIEESCIKYCGCIEPATLQLKDKRLGLDHYDTESISPYPEN